MCLGMTDEKVMIIEETTIMDQSCKFLKMTIST